VEVTTLAELGTALGTLVLALATAEAEQDVVYLTISLRNVGTGLAILNAWRFFEERPRLGVDPVAPSLDEFHRLTRDLNIAPQDIGFWQGVFRDPQEEPFGRAQRAVTERTPFTIDLL
jgi:hypothetical protein